MKFSMKWMILVGLLSASVACGDSIEKKTPVVEVENSSGNADDQRGDDPEDGADANDGSDTGDDDARDTGDDHTTDGPVNEDPRDGSDTEDPVDTEDPTDNPNNQNNVDPTEYRPIHVQLTWQTPADSDQTDTNGTDLDVHVAHPLAAEDPEQKDHDLDGKPDPWFHPDYDCSWRNATPDWGSTGDAHNPIQDMDDVDGQGPENVNIAMPENVEYRIAAHYFEDRDFGQSIAYVKIFVGGELVAEFENGLEERDMWEVATIDGRTGEVRTAGRLTSNYDQSGLF